MKDLLIQSITAEFAKNNRSIFSTMVLTISDLLNVKYAMIGIADESLKTITIRALSHNQQLQDNFTYEVKGMPCGEVLTKGFFCLSNEEHLIKNINQSPFGPDIKSYLGIGLKNDEGKVIGHFCLIDNKPLENTELIRSLLELYSTRLSLELQREFQQKEIESLECHRWSGAYSYGRNTAFKS